MIYQKHTVAYIVRKKVRIFKLWWVSKKQELEKNRVNKAFVDVWLKNKLFIRGKTFV